jgi:hypothetical protein
MAVATVTRREAMMAAPWIKSRRAVFSSAGILQM